MEYLQIIVPAALALVLSLIATPVLIPYLRRMKAGQSIREEGPQSHQVKAGTPTMGGLAIIAAVVIASLITGPVNGDMIIALAAFVAFGALGFLDDFVKVKMKRNLGLTAFQKLMLQIVIAAVLAIYQANLSETGTSIFIPFFNVHWDLGWAYVPFVAFVVVAMTNAVNLTDGLDGLASGVTMIVALFLTLVGHSFGFPEMTAFSASILGACLGFLFFNHYPAKVFMGDTGSLALGGGIAAAAIMMNIELIIPLAGGVYVAEVLSVILQVAYFKLTHGKRLFKMSPLHHHFELCGWKETKVVAVFWIVTAILCTVSFLAL
ncbi:MAG: phospho-N-acetylmuramoyl-pentapeptide-transferase [Clostridiales bacterium]|nr:phospho-N-acetylmuramoyl-pentapeptide-transferase [Clostridiales bacterium]MBQ3107648.1 phospho-N-acetylmuramoyl-pentapeptide-transferase [Bacillota bacterium]